MTGDKMIFAYRNAFKEILERIIDTWIPSFEAYKDVSNANGILSEVQNKP
jgi:hypothetical protein